jgi:hypothetical protein
MRVALAIALLLGTASAAAADGIYVTESFGRSNVKNELGNHIADTVRIRFSLGYRLSKSWAVEGFVAGDLGRQASRLQPSYALRCVECGSGGGGYDSFNPGPSTLTTAGVDVKYLRPLGRLEVYLRGSLGKGWHDRSGYEGRGFGVGAGVQLKGKVRGLGFLFWPLFFVPRGPKVTAALFVDTGADFYRLRSSDVDNPDSIDGSLHHIAIGWAVGTDF